MKRSTTVRDTNDFIVLYCWCGFVSCHFDFIYFILLVNTLKLVITWFLHSCLQNACVVFHSRLYQTVVFCRSLIVINFFMMSSCMFTSLGIVNRVLSQHVQLYSRYLLSINSTASTCCLALIRWLKLELESTCRVQSFAKANVCSFPILGLPVVVFCTAICITCWHTCRAFAV